MTESRKGAKIHIGTSGWHYKHWMGIFYPQDLPASEMLPFYLNRFSTVEINNTFYALPLEKTVKNWHSIVPDDFCFAVKASRYITHIKRLIDPGPALEKFFDIVDHLKEKLGPILFQFPPHWKLNLERLQEFLPLLPGNHSYAFEFRHPTWYDPKVYQTLKNHNIAFCIYDKELKETPLEITGENMYIRFHGSGHPFNGNYTTEHLRIWADRIGEWRKKVQNIWIYFNNDWHGYALNNAFELRGMLS